MCHCILLRPGGFNGSYPFITPTLPWSSSLLLTRLFASFRTVHEKLGGRFKLLCSSYFVISFRNKAFHSSSWLFGGVTPHISECRERVVSLILHKKRRFVRCKLSSARLKAILSFQLWFGLHPLWLFDASFASKWRPANVIFSEHGSSGSVCWEQLTFFTKKYVDNRNCYFHKST